MDKRIDKETENVLNYFRSIAHRNDLSIHWADSRCGRRYAIVLIEDNAMVRLTQYMTSKEWNLYIDGMNFICNRLQQFIKI